MTQTLSKKDIIAYAAQLTIRAINVHYPANERKTKYLVTQRQFDVLLRYIYMKNIGRKHIAPTELMF